MMSKIHGGDGPFHDREQAARALNLRPSALDLYEREGLIRPARLGGRACYTPHVLARAAMVLRLLHEDGMSLSRIKRLMAEPAPGGRRSLHPAAKPEAAPTPPAAAPA
ncbi:MerR family transcriptional regulator [Dissulfurirhabdus thermomarina]|uniref:MerR family transcriptional regulator n=1 Tax=Dissulfurirhabdus thermomarina TaxID=1765737 RepID=A0A6N9TQS3_DISTH|nr:helix-turn-helix domain-containing protein [Dissulfurirhabdus thermomarina]NDY43605.1 MerR family transcriptional regulator [Dissulfurirhabdus thermomarina]NMX23148.1 MerR family transcriptional regulator [Dissulfurirhabdus thermomarina]